MGEFWKHVKASWNVYFHEKNLRIFLRGRNIFEGAVKHFTDYNSFYYYYFIIFIIIILLRFINFFDIPMSRDSMKDLSHEGSTDSFRGHNTHSYPQLCTELVVSHGQAFHSKP